MDINYLLIKHSSLNKLLNESGGRSAIEGNYKLGKIYEKLLIIENKILRQFGLPLLMEYRDVLLELANTENHEKKFAETINFLQESAIKYLNSTPEGNITLLENAKLNNLTTYDILPEIGIEDGLYAMFIYEEVFKKDKENAKNTISIIQNTEEETLSKLGYFHYYLSRNENITKTNKIFKDLSNKGVKYLKEFSEFRPTYPY